jgi:hypothetical protein
LLVWLAGIVIALITWKKHPRVSLLAVVALAILLILNLVGSALNMLLPLYLQQSGVGFSQIGIINIARGIVQALVVALAWSLILAAMFGWRKAEAPRTPTGE